MLMGKRTRAVPHLQHLGASAPTAAASRCLLPDLLLRRAAERCLIVPPDRIAFITKLEYSLIPRNYAAQLYV